LASALFKYSGGRLSAGVEDDESGVPFCEPLELKTFISICPAGYIAKKFPRPKCSRIEVLIGCKNAEQCGWQNNVKYCNKLFISCTVRLNVSLILS
jgi:hypothetical protein